MSKTILIIDDQIASRRMLRFALDLQGYHIVDADDVGGALAAGRARKVGLLVLGLNASENENFELIVHVRQQPEFNRLPILLLVNKRFVVHRILPSSGNYAWLDKPVRMNELHFTVACLINDASTAGLSIEKE